ncbi:serine hydrolase domain-containing protein [Homoserinibacter sp. YIM 151385]|uniref:serine hydrolase domain-containing protein n=1 Tax=Homoserinibacter sp. YIM 151385 TaxID=2985506 RepID=UPI0022F0BFDC|nr:serine hydrolase domain-containing protein [Homoserinibacter sp. YIM 151385]WBU37568.1 serine hydrolase [Homoserinibacter sp. YIM 151385]
MRARTLTALPLLAATSLLAGCGILPAPERADSESELQDAAQSAVEALVGAGAPAAVAHVRGEVGEVSAAAGTRGTSEGPGGEPAQPDDAVRIASVTKPMVATVVLQLAEEGRLGLDDEVEAHLPGVLANAPGPVTVRQLLNHTSGLPDYIEPLLPDAEAITASVGREYREEELLAAAATVPWESEPGSAFVYSNTGYTVLGMLVETVTGSPIEAEVETRILEPLGMDATVWPEDETMPEASLRGYLETDDGPVDVTAISPTLWSAGAGLVSTVGDVDRFFSGLAGGELVTQESMEAMSDTGANGYGLGILQGRDACGFPPGTVLGQRGNGFGYRTASFGSPDGERHVTLSWTSTRETVDGDAVFEASLAELQRLLGATCPA